MRTQFSNNQSISLTQLLHKAHVHFRENMQCFGVRFEVDLEHEFIFKPRHRDKMAGHLTELLFESFCNAKFSDEKWIRVEGRLDKKSNIYELKISDSKAQIVSSICHPLSMRLAVFFKFRSLPEFDDRVFYNYTKYRLILDSEIGDLQIGDATA